MKAFRNIVVYPTQELLRHLNRGALFRGGPDWPYFPVQISARHCWRAIPTPVDSRPHRSEEAVENAESAIWCGPVCNHFGHMIADFGMRIAASSRLDRDTPLLFSLRDAPDAEPPPFFWQILDHLGVERSRIMLLRKPTRFDRVVVLPQAERRFGGAPSRRHLQMMDAIAAPTAPTDRDLDSVFVSRARWPMGRFAGELYLDETMAAAGVHVFHPETVDLHAQLNLYRRARRLIFSEGSAVHALQLLGHLDAELIVLARRPGLSRLAAASLRPRARPLHYIGAAGGLIHGLTAAGLPQEPAGITVLDERRLLGGLQRLGLDLAPVWEAHRYAEHRDSEIGFWLKYRLSAAAHPGERATIEKRLRAVSLGHLLP